jgi:hypothetical protein
MVQFILFREPFRFKTYQEGNQMVWCNSFPLVQNAIPLGNVVDTIGGKWVKFFITPHDSGLQCNILT